MSRPRAPTAACERICRSVRLALALAFVLALWFVGPASEAGDEQERRVIVEFPAQPRSAIREPFALVIGRVTGGAGVEVSLDGGPRVRLGEDPPRFVFGVAPSCASPDEAASARLRDALSRRLRRGLGEGCDVTDEGAAWRVTLRSRSSLDGVRAIDLVLAPGRVELRTAIEFDDLERSYERVPPPPGLRLESPSAWEAFVANEIQRYEAAMREGGRYEPADPGRIVMPDLQAGGNYVVVEDGSSVTTFQGAPIGRLGPPSELMMSAPIELSGLAEAWCSERTMARLSRYPLFVVDGQVVGMLTDGLISESSYHGPSVWVTTPASRLWSPAARTWALLDAELPTALRLTFLAESTTEGEFLVAFPFEEGRSGVVTVREAGGDPAQAETFRFERDGAGGGPVDRLAALLGRSLAELDPGCAQGPGELDVDGARRFSLLRLGALLNALASDAPEAVLRVARAEEEDGQDDGVRDLVFEYLWKRAQSDPLGLVEIAETSPPEVASVLRSFVVGALRSHVEEGEPSPELAVRLLRLASCPDLDLVLRAIEAYVRVIGDRRPMLSRLAELMRSGEHEAVLGAIELTGWLYLDDPVLVEILRDMLDAESLPIRAYAAACLLRLGATSDETRRILASLDADLKWLVEWARGRE